MNIVNGWATIPLAIVGFLIALQQISKTRDAAEAAKDAAEAATKHIGSNLLLVVLPQLVQIETNLEWAVGRGDRNAAIHYLGAWRWQAGQVRGHLMTKKSPHAEFLAQLQTSIAIAADTKLALQDPAADIPRRTKSVQKMIALVTGMVGELTARNSLEGTLLDAHI
ncbi:hypothetical protein [Cryobacterium zhongshanensis]|uniref:Uncharacterized protein n=1 Tax=Cryobacterium zhongshanensis TaxID=2928153 RepID=A0AA41QUI4_9MICO|nr:hypothetical protein [Cryobacterium zhongshanensis]MCI4657555.1 hypothetical protein [Cryobacterium zhongshanensis]